MPATDDVARPRAGISLAAKVLVGFLVVLGAVLVPTYLVLRGGVRTEIREAMLRQLDGEAAALAARLGEIAPGERAARIAALIASAGPRLTVISADGVVLGDSQAGDRPLDNHKGRPEVAAALADGAGTSIRRSATLGETLLYAARRLDGPDPLVVRLAAPASRADRAAGEVLGGLGAAGAAALSAAVVLSLVVALWLARPLRKIAAGARAVAAGDLGHVVAVRSRDELGDVAHALGELAAQLRGRLLEAGADRIALRCLVDELPVGVVLYDVGGQPVVINGAARALLHLEPARELDDAARLPTVPAHAGIVARVKASARSEAGPLALPWRAAAEVTGRWLAVPRADGQTQFALVVSEGDEPRVEPPPAPDELAVVELGALAAEPIAQARERGAARRVGLEVELGDAAVKLVEARGRVAGALRRALHDAIAAAEAGATLRVRVEPRAADLRLAIGFRGGTVRTRGLRQRLAGLGGDAGAEERGEEIELWLVLPRA